jgi:hypothetical protein
MLIQDYSYYLLKILSNGLMSITGFLAIFLLLGSFVAFSKLEKFRGTAFSVLLAAGLTLFLISFYSAVYEFEEHPEQIVFDSLPAGEPNCGTAWSGWIRGAYGLGNSCPEGCFRGNVLRKQMKMEGFPPWPMYKREIQCWKR